MELADDDADGFGAGGDYALSAGFDDLPSTRHFATVSTKKETLFWQPGDLLGTTLCELAEHGDVQS